MQGLKDLLCNPRYDMTFPGVHIQAGGPFSNESKLHELRSNVTLVRNHPALLGKLTQPPPCTGCLLAGTLTELSLRTASYKFPLCEQDTTSATIAVAASATFR